MNRPRPMWGETTPGSSGRAFSSQNWRTPSLDKPETEERPRPKYNDWKSASAATRPDNDQTKPDASSALAEGRRIYVGNLRYIVQQEDVAALSETGNYNITFIDISIDPFTARNPSYCFVELGSKEEAERALRELNRGTILGRPVKLGPCVPKTTEKGNWNSSRELKRDFNFDRWGRSDASDYRKGYTETGRRLFVGGLPKPPPMVEANREMNEFFKDFKVEAFSKTLSPDQYQQSRADLNTKLGYYMFVDMESPEEADAAEKALDGTIGPWGHPVKVQKAGGRGSNKAKQK